MQSIPVYLLAALASMCLFGCSGRPAAPEDISPPPAISDVKEGTAVTAEHQNCGRDDRSGFDDAVAFWKKQINR